MCMPIDCSCIRSSIFITVFFNVPLPVFLVEEASNIVLTMLIMLRGFDPVLSFVALGTSS